MDRPVRVGAVSYLNTKPLIHDLACFAPQAELALDVPSRLADRLFDGQLDVALIPVVELFGRSDYRLVSNACIACRGPVLSVKLFCRKRPEAIRQIALDEGSRTSAALVRVLLSERFGIAPQSEPLPLGATPSDTSADAVLLIGDRAIHPPPGPFVEVWDVGEEWINHTGLPFVFAAWVAKAEAELFGVEVALAQARDHGLAHLPEIARREAPLVGLTAAECLAYLRDNLHFKLGPREQLGLARFYELASGLGLAPAGADLDFTRCQLVG